MELEEDRSGENCSTITSGCERSESLANWDFLALHLSFFLFFERLRRIYILFNAKHGLNAFDARMLSMLSESLVTTRGVQPFTLQAIITKADTVPVDQLESVIVKMRKDIWAAAPLCLPPIVTSTELSPPFGVDLVRHNITNACNF